MFEKNLIGTGVLMKIAFVYDAIYPDAIGGGEKRNWEVARRLVRRGHEVWLIGMQFWPGDATIRREGVVCAGVCSAMPIFKSSGRRSIIEPLYFAWHLFKFLRRQRFDIIDCGIFPYLSCFVAKFFAMIHRSPLVLTWYETRGLRGWWNYSGWAGVMAYAFEIGVAHLTRNNVAISPLTLERASRIYPALHKNMKLIGCGVEAARPAAPRPGPRRICRLLYLGRLVAHKRVDWLVDVMRELAPEFPDLSLLIVGQGASKQALVDLAQAQGMKEKIEFKDFLDQDKLQDEMERSDILVFPSEQEGFGLVIIEAMAAGLPVVVADAPLSAARIIVADGQNGLLVKSSRDMARAVRKLITNDQLYHRLAQAGAATAARYDWDSVILPAQEQYYRQLLN